MLSIRQAKTGDEVRLPLPPQAAAIWCKYAARLLVKVQQYRDRYLKLLMVRAQLSRDFVQVQYVKGKAKEEVVPLWQVVTTRTARHSGADMVLLGSGGDAAGPRRRLRPRRAGALRPLAAPGLGNGAGCNRRKCTQNNW